VDPTSISMSGEQTVVDCTSIQNGQIHGRLDFSLEMGGLSDFADSPFLFLGHATSNTGISSLAGAITITNSQIVAPEPFTATTFLEGSFLLLGASALRSLRRTQS